ncbi:MAG: hypothetical protein LBN95_00345 [Prevotellaceae bacterium]|jgi:hypothetical protein|nr:hypothetical protein [Prevotellaceae bacterium]
MTNKFSLENNSPSNPFDVPDGYFESFALKIEQQITPRKIPLWQKTRPYLYAAAMFALVFTMGTIFVKNTDITADKTPVIAYDENTNELMLEGIDEDVLIDQILANVE